jgi:hypothetical protein
MHSTLIRITHAIPKPPAASCTLEFRLGIYSLETPMSTREMMSQDRRTTTMSGLATAGEASGAEIIVPVGGDEVVVSTGSGSTSCSWLPSKLAMGRGRTLAEAVICWGKSVARVTPFSTQRQLACSFPLPPFPFLRSILVKFMRFHVLIIKSFQ